MSNRIKRLLVLDATFLAYRAHYSTGRLMYGDTKIGVAFGILRDLDTFIGLFSPDVFIFAFDYGQGGLRLQVDPSYKRARRERVLTKEEQRFQQSFVDQVSHLQQMILPEMGYKNILRVKGYEADDIVAQVCIDADPNEDVVIVSADEDLFQCLTSTVSLYNPAAKQMVTAQRFKEQWGIDPAQWATVKSIAGCPGDGVTGIRGVGKVTAIKWLRGQLDPKCKRFNDIETQLDLCAKNLRLIRLPFPGLELPRIREDEVTEKKRIDMMLRLGIRGRRVTAME
mgnify:CR=1 FL=1